METPYLSWANCNSFEESDYVFVGLPDESHSHSLRKGTSKAPDVVRKISLERDVYFENNQGSPAYTNKGKNRSKIFDFGNIPRDKISQVYDKIFQNQKIPITVGGDHSLTTPIIRELGKHAKPISLVYFDAHPDFLSSTRNFYGSVIFDILPYIDVKSSVMIGIRSPEQEEVENIKKYGMKVISPEDIEYFGLKQTINEVLATIGKNTYVSFDMDCLDPSFAPGVSVPVPLGLDPIKSTLILKKVCETGILGMDIMEICPELDVQDNTSHLASRLIGEFLASAKIQRNIPLSD
jgi:agmatinase